MLSGGIVITVVEIERGKIRLGIEAPREVIVTREELLTTTAQIEDLKGGR